MVARQTVRIGGIRDVFGDGVVESAQTFEAGGCSYPQHSFPIVEESTDDAAGFAAGSAGGFRQVGKRAARLVESAHPSTPGPGPDFAGGGQHQDVGGVLHRYSLEPT